MESKNELKEIDIKNHMCYHFADILKLKILILKIF